MKTTALITSALLTLGVTSIVSAADVATMKGKTISVEEYKKAIEGLGAQGEMVKKNPRIRTQFLNHLIDNTLLSKEAKSAKIEKSTQYAKMVEDAKRDILARLYVDKYIKEQTVDAKLKEYFNKNKKEFSSKEIRASHILLKEADKKKAEDLLKQAIAGKDFAALAKEHSTGPSKGRGGDLNFFAAGRMVPEFEKAAFATAKGKVHPNLVKTQFGWHIIKVTDQRGGDKVTFADKKDDVKRAVEKNGRKNLLESLRSKAQVKVNEDVLKELKF